MTMELIEPDHFDAVVVTSGLPEVLIASALARAGKSVLVLDAADSYGASWSSLSGTDFVHHLMNRHLETKSQSPLHNDAAQAPGNRELVQQQTTNAISAADPTQSADAQDNRHPAVVRLHSVRPLFNHCGSAALYTHPDVEQLLENRQLIIDLAPRVVYQDESLVQLLVSCQAHNYLDFKLVGGSYIYQSGRLRSVPASRADLFADKSLSLADKHSLGRFLTACMEAQQGFGRLKNVFGSRPLVDLLILEGLSQTLQQVVLYGIAMSDILQQQQQAGHIDIRPAGADMPAHASSSDNNSSSSSSSGSRPRQADLLTASEGLAALQLYTTSLGRYGGKGAFMAPCYGCGSVPEAFVRLAAVKGAVTALRHGAEELKVLSASQQQQQEQPQQLKQQLPQQQDQAEHSSAIPADSTASGSPPGTATVGQQTAAAGATEAPARAQVKLTSGQNITANTVIGCCDAFDSDFVAAGSGASAASTVPAASQSPSCSSSSSVTTHAVALLDSRIVDDDNSLLLVFPPGSLHPEQTAVIRGLQFGPALAVTPPGKYLLYLTAVKPQHTSSTASKDSSEEGSGRPGSNGKVQHSSLCEAEQVLRPAIEALLCTGGLEAVSFGQPEHAAAAQQHQQEVQQEQPAISSAVAGQDTVTAEHLEEQQQQHQRADTQKPQVLALCYYTIRQPAQQASLQQQRLQQHKSSQQQSVHPDTALSLMGHQSSPVLLCPSAPPGYTGYQAVIHSTEAAYRQHFPGLPWLTDRVRPKASPSASSNAAGKGHESVPGAVPGDLNAEAVAEGTSAAAAAETANEAADLDDNNDAIDELTAALAELAALADPGK